MKVLLVVFSYHHGNTAKVAEVFARVLDARVKTPRQTDAEELRDYDLIGFSSGIDSDKHYAELLDLADSLPSVADRKAFIFSTCGMPVRAAGKNAVARYASKSHTALREKLASRGYEVIGEFSCAGHTCPRSTGSPAAGSRPRASRPRRPRRTSGSSSAGRGGSRGSGRC
jgi:flavodoxin